MESDETSPAKESDGMLKVFLANTRSVKGKTTELKFLTTNSDIVCLTETHLDDTILNSSLLPIKNKTVFCRDRNICGGGVMMAVCRLNPKLLDLREYRKELVAVKFNHEWSSAVTTDLMYISPTQMLSMIFWITYKESVKGTLCCLLEI